MNINEEINEVVKNAVKAAFEDLKIPKPMLFMSPKDVAVAIGGVSEATVRRWCREKELHYHQLGKFVRIRVEDYEKFCKDGKVAHN